MEQLRENVIVTLEEKLVLLLETFSSKILYCFFYSKLYGRQRKVQRNSRKKRTATNVGQSTLLIFLKCTLTIKKQTFFLPIIIFIVLMATIIIYLCVQSTVT